MAEPQYPSMPRPDVYTFKNRAGPPIQFTPGSRRYPAPPDQDPLTIFKPMVNICTVPGVRWVELDRTGGTKHAVLLFTDGAAPNNGQPNVRAGCGISIRPDGPGDFSFPLERVGNAPLTSNRAELRAAHAAFGLRFWLGEGFEKIVIGTDSEYLVKGVNEWVPVWEKNGWRNGKGQPVKNKDLWQMLIAAIEKHERLGITVQFYLMQRRFNKADAAAKRAAETTEGIPDTWVEQTAIFDGLILHTYIPKM